jgi:2-dehydropantoate 2-reductase
VGATIGARLHQAGQDVIAIARGPHLEAMQARGLRLRTPGDDMVVPVAAVGSPAEIDWRDGDVVILAMKTQDTAAALTTLVAAGPADMPVVCAQNGVENERLAARLFPNVYGICVMLPAALTEPGVVEANGAPLSGLLDVGRYPGGVDATAEGIAAVLSGALFGSEARPDIMRSKYRKLIMNLSNVIEAAAGTAARASDLYDRAVAEAETALAAAGIEVASPEEDQARRGELMRMKPIGGKKRDGGSTWQSLARASGSVETDYLNGEIVLLGRQFGVPTPVNAGLQRLGNRLARDLVPPGSMSLEELEAEIDGS